MALSTGWDLPLQALPDWLKGLPAPGLDVEESVLEGNLLRQLLQGGWQVLFQSYGVFGDYTLPTRLSIERGDTSAKVILRQWQVL